MTTEEDNTIEGSKREIKSKGVEKKTEEVGDLLQKCRLNGSTLEYVDSEEEVVEGFVVGVPNNNKVLADNDGSEDDGGAGEVAIMVNIDTEDAADGDKATEHARSIKVEFDPADIKFWFVQLEDEMTMAAVKSQWLKKTVLQLNLPLKQKEDVKELLSTPKEGAGLIYQRIKLELLRIYAQKPCDTYRKALTRTMVGLPSQLGYQHVRVGRGK